jgi:hypothetical protein
MARFAAQTHVGVDQTRVEIERTLSRYGATAFGYITQQGKAIIAFEATKRHIKITVPLPVGEDEKTKQQARQRWRALLLVIKAKLESVESGIETLEEAFYANIVMPDGRTIYESTREHVAVAYSTGKVQGLLPNYSKQKAD